MTRVRGAETHTRRTPNDVSALCVELLRAVREQEFRARHRNHRNGPAPSVDRAWRAWRSDLDRHGPLHLVADGHGLREGVDGPPVGRGRHDELARRLRERVLASLIFEPGLDAPTYAGLVALLVADPQTVERHGGALGFLPERGVGIRLQDSDEALAACGEERKPEPEEDADATQPTLGEPDPDTTVPFMEPPPAPPAARSETLEALAACKDDAAFSGLVTRLVGEATEQGEAGEIEAFHRAVLALAGHADADGPRSAPQRAAALGGLREICAGPRISDLLERAAARDGDASRSASHVLRLLAEQAGPALISAIDVQTDPARRADLMGIAVSLGRATTPALHRAMEGSSPDRARIAAHLAGEIRDERTVPSLSKLLEHREAEVRAEAARALAQIGGAAALSTLKHGLESPHEDVSSLCAYCLGVSGTEGAAQALTETLRQARRARRNALASAVIRSLGRLGREESVPELSRIVQKRSFFRRHELHELKLQSISALAKLPGKRAQDVLEAVAGGSDMSLAVAARRALKERADAERAA